MTLQEQRIRALHEHIDELEAELTTARTAARALYDFLDALLVAKRNDDVMSVVDAMLAVHVEASVASPPADREEP